MSAPDIGHLSIVDGRGATVALARVRLHRKLDGLHVGAVDPMIPAGDYLFQAIDEYLTDTGVWSSGLRRLKREARRVRMARKRRRGWA